MKERIFLFAEKGRTWVLDNLRMALIVGVGSIEREWIEVNRSYKSALDALQHKLSLGKDAIIMSEDLPVETSRIWSKHLQLIADFVKEFRLSSGEWREQLERIFDGLESDVLKDEDIRMLLQMLMDMLSRELIDLSDSLQDQLKGEAYKIWKRAVEEAVHLEQMRVLFLEHLTEIYRTYVTVRETKSHHAMINEMKAYIEENFVNPDLSLKHLSERFSISGKYASYLFKEEFDMNFADFLVQLRMKHAEHLLAETEETIQNIALQVGYANSITFGRMFKREIGITPGDYRKFKMKPDK
ncbi:Regulatory protein SoxS [compost metagenome]